MPELDVKNGMVCTYRNVIMPWQCDQNGHLNTRFYMEIFDSAASALLSLLKYSMAHAKSSGFGWVDARHEIDYLGEVRDGEMVTAWSCVESLGNTSMKYRHDLFSESGDAKVAQLIGVMVHFDLTKRAKTALPANFRDNAAGFLNTTR